MLTPGSGKTTTHSKDIELEASHRLRSSHHGHLDPYGNSIKIMFGHTYAKYGNKHMSPIQNLYYYSPPPLSMVRKARRPEQ